MANSSFLITPDSRTAFARFQKHLQELDPLALVWLLMPGPLSRKWRAQAASSLNVHLLTLDQLASNLLRSAGYTQIVLNQRQRLLCLTHLMEEAHREQQLKVLPTPSQTPNLVKYVDLLIQELKQAKISTIEFQNAAIRSGQSRDMDLAHLYSQYEAALESDGSWDAASLLPRPACRKKQSGRRTDHRLTLGWLVTTDSPSWNESFLLCSKGIQIVWKSTIQPAPTRPPGTWQK